METGNQGFIRDYLKSVSGHIFSGESIGNTPSFVTVYIEKDGDAFTERRGVLPRPRFNYRTLGWPKPF